MELDLTSIVVYYVSTMWISTKPGFIHLVTDLSGTLIKVGFGYLSVFANVTFLPLLVGGTVVS